MGEKKYTRLESTFPLLSEEKKIKFPSQFNFSKKSVQTYALNLYFYFMQFSKNKMTYEKNDFRFEFYAQNYIRFQIFGKAKNFKSKTNVYDLGHLIINSFFPFM